MLLAVALALADSPLTSIDFVAAYADVPAVLQAADTRRLEGAALETLLGGAPLDHKVAVVNALGWSAEGQDHAGAYLAAVARQRRLPLKRLTVDQLSAEERFLYGYLRAMDDYLGLTPSPSAPAGLAGLAPLDLLDDAARALPEVFSVQYVRALVAAQAQMAGDWCAVWRGPEAVRERFPEGRRDLRPAAVAAAVSYLELYASECAPALPPGATVPREPAFDEVYALARSGDVVAAATQGGVVLWREGRAEAAWRQPLCTSVVAHGGAFWAGCREALVRWDGAWTVVLTGRSDGEGEGFAVFEGPDGSPRVAHGARQWRMDGASPVLTSGRTGYDTLDRRNGERWTVDFLAAVEGPAGPLPVRSAAYPGSDPRSLYEDPKGTLWVVDFASGLFTWDDRAGRFFAVPGAPAKASAVRVDGDGRAWMLAYTDGLVVRETDGRTRTLPLPQGEYLRDLVLDGRGGAWVASWHGVLRLEPAGAGWTVTAWRAADG